MGQNIKKGLYELCHPVSPMPLCCLVVGHICISLELEDSTVGGQNFFMVGGDLTERNLGRKPQNIFEIFILEITACKCNKF